MQAPHLPMPVVEIAQQRLDSLGDGGEHMFD
jgi:hypothetical protein